MALTAEKFDASSAQAVAEKYAAKFGTLPDVLHTRTGEGAAVQA